MGHFRTSISGQVLNIYFGLDSQLDPFKPQFSHDQMWELNVFQNGDGENI